jgi:DNA-binding response OmpR family regulator
MTLAAAVDISRFPAPVPVPDAGRVLIAEDERKLRGWLIDQFLALGVVPLVAESGYEAIRIAGESRPAVILLDGLLPQMHGFEIARFVRRIDADYRPHIVLMTAIYKTIRYQNEARLKYGIDEYLVKPLHPGALASLVTRAKEAA